VRYDPKPFVPSTPYALQWSNVVLNEKITSGIQEWKNLSQKEHEQVFLYIKEHEFDLDQDIFSKSVPPPKIIHLEKQMNPSC
jgi:late competence protein required for DNA uptake (superfamily II DNA/RNA helicase)